jgi:hypothetical protein
MLEDGGEQLATSRCGTEVIRWTDDRRDPGRDVLGVEAGTRMTVDQEPVATEHDCGVDALTLPDGGDQITNARHVGLSMLPAKWWRS